MKLPRLYVITDREAAARGCGDVATAVVEAMSAGAKMFQFRDKQSPPLEQWRACERVAGALAARGDCALLVNDRADLATAVGADGVHRPADGLPIAALRRLMESPRLVGVSCHDLEEVRAARDDGADFVTLSPIFETASKPDATPIGPHGLEDIAMRVDVPIYALGGVTPDNARECVVHGAHGVAVLSGIMAAEDPYQATFEYLGALT